LWLYRAAHNDASFVDGATQFGERVHPVDDCEPQDATGDRPKKRREGENLEEAYKAPKTLIKCEIAANTIGDEATEAYECWKDTTPLPKCPPRIQKEDWQRKKSGEDDENPT
jgi:hypothetical protein